MTALALAAASTATARAQSELAPLRVGVAGSLGYLGSPQDVVVGPNVVPMWSAGFGLELRLGVQATEWLAFDLSAFAETLFFYGDARAALSMELAPHPMFAVAVGAAVGSMYMANLFYPSPSADYVAGALRLEVRIHEEPLTSSPSDIVLGVEGQLGASFAGAVPPGTVIGGARLLVGFLLR